ncbi:G1/S-specific cyclin pas1 [Smittium mucronatum]|uniref:G1/S-specific cyclin pas1 n=1 Tax=Smittium mucronatum TaxID=133383 RepID=A0A1R0GVE2_9FUNG|nr:G1/S-specific cyclin pas1 [Smittium mucronatum]
MVIDQEKKSTFKRKLSNDNVDLYQFDPLPLTKRRYLCQNLNQSPQYNVPPHFPNSISSNRFGEILSHTNLVTSPSKNIRSLNDISDYNSLQSKLSFEAFRRVFFSRTQILVEKKYLSLINLATSILGDIISPSNSHFAPDRVQISNFVTSIYRSSKLFLVVLEVSLILLLRFKNALYEASSHSHNAKHPVCSYLSNSSSFFKTSLNVIPENSNFPKDCPALSENSFCGDQDTPNMLPSSSPSYISPKPPDTLVSSPLLPKAQSVPSASQTKSTEFCIRVFLASLICASKFCLDKSYNTRAWSKLAGFPPQQINRLEMGFLGIINHRLFVSHSQLEQFRLSFI